MHAYVLHGKEDLRGETRDEPIPGDDDVLLEIRRIGICGSDVHYYNHFRIGEFVPQAPLVLGHEFAGEVVETGKGVERLAVGDRVTAEPSIPCRHCRYCVAGRYNLCERLRFIGTAATVPHIDGAFAERVVVPASQCIRLSRSLSYAAGALVEPMAVGMHAVMRAGQVVGRRVLITGGGTIGQTVLSSLTTSGAVDVTVADPSMFAREFSEEHGAAAVFDPTDEDERTSVLQQPFDLLFECSGAPAGLELCHHASARGATIVQVGTQGPSVTLPVNLVMSRELSVLGSFRYAHDFPSVVGLMEAGHIAVDDFVSATYPFENLPEAVRRATEGRDVIKVQVSRE